MLDRAGDLALKTPDALLRVDEHSAHHPPPFRWLGNLFQNGPMCGHGDRAISPPKQRATVLPAVPTTSGRSREPEHSRRRSPQEDPLSANAYPAALGLSLITGGRSHFGMWGPSSLALCVRLFGMINAARPRSPLSHCLL